MYQEIPFERLEEEYKPLLLKVIKSMHLYQDMDSYYQIGLIGLWEASTRFDPEKGVQFSTFAYSTIRGRLLDYLKKEKQYEERSQSLGEEHVSSLVDNLSKQPFENEWIKQCNIDLTLNQKKWLQGRIIEDKSYKEIACEHGVTVDSVKSWGKQTIKKLREAGVGSC